jgi:signal peptidase I
MVILAFILMAGLLGSFIFSAVLLWLAAKLLRAPKAGLLRALVVTLVGSILYVFYASIALWMRQEFANDGDLTSRIGRELLLLLVFLVATIVLIMRVFDTSFWRALAIWFLNLIPAIALVPILVVLLKLFVMETFTVPTNGMAPTILGWHHEMKCPRCQGTLITAAPDPNIPDPPRDPETPGICLLCRKTSVSAEAISTVHDPDRIVVTKLQKPERWDVIVFRYPKDPAQRYVKRLVGLPGEKVYVKGDSVWINDVKMDLPESLAGLEYTDKLGFELEFGSEEKAVQLGIDEFFVLGDFSKSSSDSRVWGPLPGVNIEGVVCARYWPMKRLALVR